MKAPPKWEVSDLAQQATSVPILDIRESHVHQDITVRVSAMSFRGSVQEVRSTCIRAKETARLAPSERRVPLKVYSFHSTVLLDLLATQRASPTQSTSVKLVMSASEES